MRPSALYCLLGDMANLDVALAKRSQTGQPHWILLDGLMAILKGIGQVIFVGNPLSGAVILVGLFCSSVYTGLAAVIAVFTALLVSLLFQQPVGLVRAGLTSFSACLVGTVTIELYPLLYKQPLSPLLFLWVMLAAALSVLVGMGLGHILDTFRLPGFTLPFNVVTSVLFLCLMPPPAPPTDLTSGQSADTANSSKVIDVIEWDQVFLGTVYSMGQVYASYTLAGSILMYLGCCIYSPILAATSWVAAVVGTLFGVVFSQPPYTSVYMGVWGYNAILSTEAIMFFVVPSARSVLLALLNATLATMIQAAMAAGLDTVRLPVFTFPFVSSTILMLAAGTSTKALKRVTNIRYPELHYRERKEGKEPASSNGGSHRRDPANKNEGDISLDTEQP